MMRRKSSLFVAVPLALNNSRLVGGQLTAARGFIDFLSKNNVPCQVLDTADFTSSANLLSRLFIRLLTLLKLIYCSISSGRGAVLFFKSTHLGLFERFLPAFLFRVRMARVGLFFRNSDILLINSGSFKEWLVCLLLRPYSVFFVQGHACKERLVAMGFAPSHVVVIPNWLPPGLDVATSHKTAPAGLIRFVFTGRVVREKGVFEILEALRSEHLRGQCEFVIAGSGPDVSACQKFVHTHNLKGVQFMGALSSEAVIDLLINSDVFVLPTYHPEGFPNSILEAMALGLPVIATDVGAITESVIDGVNGFIIPSQSPNELIRAMRRYICEPVLVETQSKETLQVAASRHGRNKNCELLLDSLI